MAKLMMGLQEEWRLEHQRRRSDSPHRDHYYAPVTLLSLAKPDRCSAHMLRAFADNYLEAVASGKIEQWRKAAISCVDLMASNLPAVHQRCEFKRGKD